MKLYEITFSPTGGTRKVCQLLTSAWQQPAEEVDLSDSRRHPESCRSADRGIGG